MLTDAEIAAARALVDSATPGPWEADIDSRMGTVDQIQRVRSNGWIESVITASSSKVVAIADAEFIAASRTMVPKLLDEVERLRAENSTAHARLLAAFHRIDYLDSLAGEGDE